MRLVFLHFFHKGNDFMSPFALGEPSLCVLHENDDEDHSWGLGRWLSGKGA